MVKSKKNKIKTRNKFITILAISMILILGFFVIPVKDGKSIFYSLTYKETLYNSLSTERQEVYDKMKIEYVNIKNRVTGTEPFNSGTTSNADGVDISDKDDYVRTFDVMKYTVELGVIPNTEIEGVTDSSSFIGGVIKVKAKLPNQGTPVLMRWEKDAWMQNVQYNDDHTEIYAEYHVSNGVSITNGNQNLTFTVKVDGYKKDVTSEMAPEFEVWMEGNKPDNASSSAEAISKTDTHNTIISGHPSINVQLAGGPYLNHEYSRDGVRGNYYNYGVIVSLYQDVPTFSDLRGIEYPVEKIEGDLEFTYNWTNVDNSTSGIINASTPNATNLSNGTIIVESGVNGDRSGKSYFPANSGNNMMMNVALGSWSFVGTGDRVKAAYDSGTFNTSINNNKIHFSFNGFKINGQFPQYVWWSDRTSRNYSDRIGIIAVGNIEHFTPYYNSDAANYDYTYNIKLANLTYKTINQTFNKSSSNGDTLDANTGDNLISIGAANRLKGKFVQYTTASQANLNPISWSVGNGATMLGNTFSIQLEHRLLDGPYEGGTDGLAVFDPSKAELLRYSYDQSSIIGFPLYDWNLKVQFGVYKVDPTNGVTDIKKINSTTYDDFYWYNTIEEANKHGVTTAFFYEDPDNKGNSINRDVYLYFRTINDPSNIGTLFNIRHKMRVYADAEKKVVYYYGGQARYTSETTYRPTVYNIDGVMTSAKSPHEYGESLIILGAQTHVTTSVSDTDSLGNKKSAYDVQDGIINFKISPTMSNGLSASDNDKEIDFVRVTTTLPKGLTFVNGSANKTPKSVTQNLDGTTNIVWEYENWKVNHAAPEYSDITFSSEISASLENNASLNIKSVIYAALDLRDEKKFRTSEYGVVISNLAGSRASKEISKGTLEQNEAFNVSSVLGNNSEEVLRNVRSIEILPYNGDNNGSKFHGTYTLKVNSLASGQKMYYTTKSVSSLNLPKDRYGKTTASGVDFTTSNGWTEVSVGETIPANATAIATVIAEMPAKSEISYNVQVIPNNNQKADVYAFALNMTSDNLQNAVKSNVVVAKVIERRISGIVFSDDDKDNIYTSSDTLLKNETVELLDEKHYLLQTATTDNKGYYEFSLEKSGYYYIKFSSKNGYDIISKLNVDNGNKANIDYMTDIIDHTIPTTQAIEYINNINLGIRKKEAQLKVRYLEKGTNKVLAPEYNETVYYTDKYETKESDKIPSEYHFVETQGDPTIGTVSDEMIEVIYYYEFKPATVTTHHYIDGTADKLSEDIKEDKKYTNTYSTSQLDTDDLDYELSRTDGDPTSGTVNKDEIVVNYYYKLKKGDVITHHYLWDDGATTKKLANDDKKTYNYRDIYTTNKSSEVTKNYELYKKTENFTGVVKAPLTEVIYYYQLKDSELKTEIKKEGPEQITSTDEKVNYIITYNAEVKEYIGNGTITIVDTLPYKIDTSKSDLKGGTYNDLNQTITWTENWNVNSYEEEEETAKKTITKEITIVYDGIVGRDRLMNNSIKGSIELTNNHRDTEGQSSTLIKIPGKIIVKYIDNKTKKDLLDPVETEDLVGEPYTSKEEEISGYKLVIKPETDYYEYEEEEQVVVYEYEKIILKVETKVNGEGGSILGDEDVLWGDDSTKDHIVIKADDGYAIENVIINGEKIDIGEGEKELVLNNFLEMKENKLIEVSFIPYNPNTAGISIIGFILVVLLTGLIIFFRKKIKVQRFKAVH